MSSSDVSIERIRLDGGTQVRVEIDPDVVADYAERIRAGDQFPPVRQVFDGESYWLIDGHQRIAAYLKLGRKTVPAQVTMGTLEEAIWESLAANRTNGQRLTNADKSKAVTTALIRWPDKTERVIAEHVGVSHTMVANVRKELVNVGKLCQHDERTGADGKTYKSSHASPKRQIITKEEYEAGTANAASRAPEHYLDDIPFELPGSRAYARSNRPRNWHRKKMPSARNHRHHRVRLDLAFLTISR